MRFFNYLNFPQLNLTNNLASEKIMYNPGVGYVSYEINRKDVIDQVLAILPKEISDHIIPESDILFQTINPHLNNYIHKDGRVFAINYLIDSGGENVETLFFNDNKELIETNIMREGSWALLHTNTFHCVTNITKLRKAITISFGGFPHFNNILDESKLKLLQEFFINYD